MPDRTRTVLELLSAFIDWFFSPPTQVAVAGFSGALVSAVADWRGYAVATRKVIVGLGCTIYLGPVFSPLFKWLFGLSGFFSLEQAPLAAGFIVGICGMSIVEAILIAVRARLKMLKETGNAPTGQ